jgi:hypothetical protein
MENVEITHDMLIRAAQRSMTMGRLRNSATDGDRNMTGFVGEEAFKAKFPDAIPKDHYDYDFLRNERTIDVKSRIGYDKFSKDFNWAIPLSKQEFKADRYFFIVVHHQLKIAKLCGFFTRKDMSEKTCFIHAGEHMPDTKGTIAKSDNIIVYLRDLRSY